MSHVPRMNESRPAELHVIWHAMENDSMGWLWIVGSIKSQVSFAIAKEPYKRDNILQKRPIIIIY